MNILRKVYKISQHFQLLLISENLKNTVEFTTKKKTTLAQK